MSALLLLPFGLLCLSGAFFFGPQLVCYGPSAIRAIWKRREAKLVAGGLAVVAAMILISPISSSGLISGGETVQVVATTLGQHSA